MPPPRSRRNLAMRMKVAANDTVERHGRAPPSIEAVLSPSSTPSSAHRSCGPRSLERLLLQAVADEREEVVLVRRCWRTDTKPLRRPGPDSRSPTKEALRDW